MGSCLCSRSRAPQREREFPVLTYHQKRVLLSSTSHFPWPEQRQEGSWRNCSGPFPARETHAMITRRAFVVQIPFHSGRTVCRSTGNNSAPTGREQPKLPRYTQGQEIPPSISPVTVPKSWFSALTEMGRILKISINNTLNAFALKNPHRSSYSSEKDVSTPEW